MYTLLDYITTLFNKNNFQVITTSENDILFFKNFFKDLFK